MSVKVYIEVHRSWALRAMSIIVLLYTLYAFTLLVVSLKLKICVTLRDFAERRSGRFGVQAVLFLLSSLSLWVLLEGLFHVVTHKLFLPSSTIFETQSQSLYESHLILFLELLSGWFAFYAILRRNPLGFALWLWLIYEVAIVTYTISLASIPLHLPEIYSSLTAQRPALAKMVQSAEAHHLVTGSLAPIFVDTTERKTSAESVGVGKYSTIVLSRGILGRFDDEQLLFVVGHETGHLTDSRHRMVISGCLMLVSVFLAYTLGVEMIVRYGSKLGVRGVKDLAGLPLFAICFVVLGYARDLGINRYQRHLEARADCFAVEFMVGEVKDPAEVAASVLLEAVPDYANSISGFLMEPPAHRSVADRIASIRECQTIHVDQRIPSK